MNDVEPALIPADVRGLCERLRGAGHEAFLVGGGIRDALLGRPPNDFDVATSALPDAVLRLFGNRYAIPTGLQHGTVTVLLGEPPHQRAVEVTTFRGEGAYLDGRRPSSVTFGATLDEDLSRRDFTMNAIAFDPSSGRLVDPFDGRGDLGRRLVRAVRDPVERFTEDGLRPMRAVRQATQLGFDVEPGTLAAISGTLASFKKVSAERIRDELCKLLAAERPSRGLELMRTTGLLAHVIPELLDGVDFPQNRHHRWDVFRHTLAAVDATRGGSMLRLAALLHDVAKPRAAAPKPDAPDENTFDGHEQVGAKTADEICRRLKLSTTDRELVVALVAQHMFVYTPEWTDGAVRRFVRRVGPDRLEPLFALREADVAARGFDEDREAETGELRRRIQQLGAAEAATTELAIDGKDVMRLLDLRPGRQVGVILNALLERVIDEPSLNERTTLEQLARELAPQLSGDR